MRVMALWRRGGHFVFNLAVTILVAGSLSAWPNSAIAQTQDSPIRASKTKAKPKASSPFETRRKKMKAKVEQDLEAHFKKERAKRKKTKKK